MGANPSEFARVGPDVLPGDVGRFPAESVSYDDAQEFLRRLNARSPDPGWVYRLPTPDEWEYACRGGPAAGPEHANYDFYLDRPTSDRLDPSRANFQSRFSPNRPCRVGDYPPNSLGLYDLHGNVAEWYQPASPGGRPVVRGESWDRVPVRQEAGRSEERAADARSPGVGVRVARVPK